MTPWSNLYFFKSKATEHFKLYRWRQPGVRYKKKTLPLRSAIKHSNFYQLAECYRNVARSRQWFHTETVDIVQSESSQCRRKLRNGWSLTITAPSRRKRICYWSFYLHGLIRFLCNCMCGFRHACKRASEFSVKRLFVYLAFGRLQLGQAERDNEEYILANKFSTEVPINIRSNWYRSARPSFPSRLKMNHHTKLTPNG